MGFSTTVCARATRVAAGLATGFDVLVPGTDLVDRAEAGRDDAAGGGREDGPTDLFRLCGAEGRGLLDDAAGRAAGGGAWPYWLLLRLTMIFCGAFAVIASLLVGLASFLGCRRGALVALVVGKRLFGGGGGGISSPESTSCSLEEAVFDRGTPGRDTGGCGAA